MVTLITIISIYILQLVAFFFACKSKLTHTAYFLMGALILDISGFILKYANSANSKPYEGIAFIIFMLSSFCLLAYPTLLFWLSSWKDNSKIVPWICNISLLGLLGAILIFYPALSGALLLQIFYAYCGGMCLLALFHSLNEFRKKPLMDKAMIAFLSVSGIIGYLVIMFRIDYIFVSVCNITSYLLIIALSYVAPRYTNLLPR